MAAPNSIVIQSPDATNPISTHQTTPLPLTRKSQKEKPVSPQTILDRYNATIREDDDDEFPNTHTHTHIHTPNTNTHNNHALIEKDPKRIKARKSFNSVMLDLSSLAANAKKEHEKRKSQDNNNTYYPSSSSGSTRMSYSGSHSYNKNIIEHPYIDDGVYDEESFSNNTPANNNNNNNNTGRYSTYVNKYSVAAPIKPKTSKVQFADLPDEVTETKPRKGRVTFAIASDNDEKKEMYHNESDSSSMSTQSDDLLDDFFNDKPNYDGINNDDIFSSAHSLHDHNDNNNKGRKSKFLKFGANFLQSTLHLTSIPMDNISDNNNFGAPGAPLPNELENSIEFSHTASTIDFNKHLWVPISDRSDSSDDSFDHRKTIKRKNKKYMRENKKRITSFKQKSTEVNNAGDMDEKELQDEIDRFKQSIMDDDDDDVDDDVFDLDDSFERNNNSYDSSSSDTMNIKNDYNIKQTGDRMWFRHHLGHLKVLKKFFREMDKDGDGTISFDEFTKFLNKYRVNKTFKPDEIERFFLKVTDVPFDPDNPNAIENKMNNIISPALITHSANSDKGNESGSRLNTRKSGVSKKTSIFFKKNKTAPSGEVDMATFLFYFSSPIDSQAMMNQKAEDELTQTDRDNNGRDTVLTNDEILPDKIRSSKYAMSYSKAAANAANKAKLLKNTNSNTIDVKIDKNLLFNTNKSKNKKQLKRHSLDTKSTSKKLKKRVPAKRGSITALSEYHKRVNKSNGFSKSNSDIKKSDFNGLNAMSLLLNRESNKYKNLKIDANAYVPSNSSNNSSSNNNNNMEEIIKLMKKSIQLQDRKSNGIQCKNCFIGRDAVTWFIKEEYASNRHNGLLLGRKLFQNGYIKYAGNEERDFEDEILFFYQFNNSEDKEKENEYEITPSHPSIVNENSNSSKDNNNNNNNERYSTLTNDTPIPTQNSVKIIEDTISTSDLISIINRMQNTIERSSYRSTILLTKTDIFSGSEIINWFIKSSYCTTRSEGLKYGTFMRRQGLIRNIEYHPTFKDEDDEWYLFINNENDNESENDEIIQIEQEEEEEEEKDKFDMGMKHIMEDEVNGVSNNNNIMSGMRATMPIKYNNINRRHNDSTTERTNTNTSDTRTSLVLGQMGRGRATRSRKREKLVQDLFTFIIRSQILTNIPNMSEDTLYAMDMIVDGIEHSHIRKLLNKIEIKFYKCDEHSRGSLGLEEFNRFLMKCGVILHQQDLNVIFKIFDKNNTGLIDYSNFAENSLVHRVPGIKTENLTVTHLIKHTISVNFGISSGKRGFDDQYTKIAMAIAAAFEEINTSATGEITLAEFRLAYRKNGIEIYGGVTQIFERLCSFNNNNSNSNTISLANFIEAFQGTIFANRAEPPTLKEILSKLGIIQWTLGDNNKYMSQEEDSINKDEDSINTVQSNITNGTAINNNYYISNKMLSVTPNNKNIITPSNNNNNNAITPSNISQDTIGTTIATTTVEPLLNNSNGYIVSSPKEEEENINHTIIPMSIEINNNDKTKNEKRKKEIQSPHVRIRLNMGDTSYKVFYIFFKSTIIISFPGVILNSLLHFLQGIEVGNSNFPLIDLTWYIFGFLVYLALQSTMVGVSVTKSLIIFYLIVSISIGTLLAIATIIGFAFEENIFANNSFIKGKGFGWWTGLFLVYLICECAARLKYMKIFGQQRTKREYLWYAIKSAIGVTLFWFIQTFVSLIVVNVSFSSISSLNRWPIILYCAITLTVIRNISLNSLGTAFIGKLSDHFYLEDVEMMELRTDQMLLTQLSIISSYSSLWYLFTKTYVNDWNWVMMGILTYQFILLFMDIFLAEYIRKKMISLLKGELIAWFVVGAKAFMNFIFPFHTNSKINKNTNSNSNNSLTHIVWIITYLIGPILLLSLLWLRIYKIWSYDNVENYWDFDEFTLCNKNNKNNNNRNNINMNNRNNNSSQTNKNNNNKQRNRLMIICALTIGFIVSVTEAVSLWSDNPNTQSYEGFVKLDF